MKHIMMALTFALAAIQCTSQKKYPVIDSDTSLARHLPMLSNWGKWKDTDELGTLNYITPTAIANAAAGVRKGITVTLARKVSMRTEGMREPKYQMQKGTLGTRDYLGAVWHGFAQTHLDALCHVFADTARMYNGLSTASIDTNGCNRLGI
ncbi:MAG TPA: hypothetical protein VD996_15690, partial [Chitinophagaceae bacterium]|nr:hypothetical protein [Chitinophagaceae bacterium]